MRRISRIGLLTAIVAATAGAQEFRGTLSGRVVDSQQSAVPAAIVLATGIEDGSKYRTVSGPDGLFTLPFLEPGTYSVSVDAPGFKRYRRDNTHIGTNERVSLDIALELGATSESVTVTAEAPMLQTDIASTGQIINQHHIENMPINGRTPLVLAQLSFGVIPNSDPRNFRPFDDGGPSGFSIGGAPSARNELLLNGSPDTTAGGTIGFNPPVDAVLEVKVETFQTDAAYGHTGGGTVNMVTKSGTNSYHGSAYEFNQTSALGANLFFTNTAGQKKAVSHYNQYGVTVGGPVIVPKVFNGRNKLFFFFAYEGIQTSRPVASVMTVPTPAERRGDFSAQLAAGANYQIYDPLSGTPNGARIARQPFADNIVPTARLNPVALNILKFYPQPNFAGKLDGTNNYLAAWDEPNGFGSYSGRLDFNLSDRNKLFWDFRNNSRDSNSNDAFHNLSTGYYLIQTNWGSSLDNVFAFSPTMVLNTRLNWQRNIEFRYAPSDGFDFSTLGFPASLVGQAQRLQMPVLNLGPYAPIGYSDGRNNPYDNFQIFSTVTKIHGRHSLKFGVDLREIRFSAHIWGNSTGTYTFGSNWTRGPLDTSPGSPLGQELASFLLGLPTGGGFDVNASQTSQNRYAAFFIQDDVRVRSNLNLNFGLRYEHEFPSTERYNRAVAGFDSTTINPIGAAAMAAYARNPIPQIPPSQFRVNGGLLFTDPDHRNAYDTAAMEFGPRFGFAWTPRVLGGKTVLRGGGGVFFFPADYGGTGILQTGFSRTSPVVPTLDGYLTPYATLADPFPDGIQQPLGSSLGLATNLGTGISFYNPALNSSYSFRWNFDIQRQVSQNTVVELAYTGNHALHLPISTSLNYVPGQYLSTLPLRDQATINLLASNVANPFAGLIPGTGLNGSTAPLSQLLTPFPQFTGVSMSGDGIGSTYFNMLAARVEKRFSHGVQFLANYSWAKMLERLSRLNSSDLVLEKRIAPEDRTQRLVVSFSWDLPFGKGRALGSGARPLVNQIIGGWTVNSVYTTQSGAPLSWGDVIYYGGDLKLNARAVNGAFDTTRFNRDSAQQRASDIRTFPTMFGNLRQDRVNNMDFSAIKNFPIREAWKLQFRGELFNAFNHAEFNAPNLSPTSAGFGLITSQANLARTIQLALRMTW